MIRRIYLTFLIVSFYFSHNCIAIGIIDSIEYNLTFKDTITLNPVPVLHLTIVGSDGSRKIFDTISSELTVYLRPEVQYKLFVNPVSSMEYLSKQLIVRPTKYQKVEYLTLYFSKISKAWGLPTIYFALNKKVFINPSKAENDIKEIIKLLNNNPNARVKLNGYIGPCEKDKLAENRVERVYAYLLKHNVPESRIVRNPIGYKQRIVLAEDVTEFPEIKFALELNLDRTYFESLSKSKRKSVSLFMASVRFEILR